MAHLLPRYEVIPSHAIFIRGVLTNHQVTWRAIRTPLQAGIGDLQYMQALVPTVQHHLLQIAGRVLPDAEPLVLANTIRGFLQGVSVDTGNAYAPPRAMPIAALTIERFQQILESIHESNPNVFFGDIEWTFILDPDSFNLGGCVERTHRPPVWVKNDFCRTTWDPHFFNGQRIHCAAVALMVLLRHQTRRDDRGQARLDEEAFELETELQWGRFTFDGMPRLPMSQLEDFVRAYPSYRVVCLGPLKEQNYAHRAWAGTEWIAPDTVPTARCSRDPKTLYIVYEPSMNHYAAVKNPYQLLRSIWTRKDHKLCEKCLLVYTGPTSDCPHGGKPFKPKKFKTCRQCRVYGDHQCPNVFCKTCVSYIRRRGNDPHRCLLIKESERPEARNNYLHNTSSTDIDLDGTLPKLWAFDFESALIREEIGDGVILTRSFVVDPATGQYILDPNPDNSGHPVARSIECTPATHVVNVVVAKDVFSADPPLIYRGPTALADFIHFIVSHNKGNNICVAHNASGYDNRLLFEEAKTILHTGVDMFPILRGSKFMQLSIARKTIFRDSLLHLKGSLKALAIDFLGPDCGLRKGYFPYLFNTPANYGYVGPLPPIDQFDIGFSMRTKQDWEDFSAWHAERSAQGPWNFDEELVAYCVNDVEVLAKVMYEYHTVLNDQFGMSPWFNPTSPSFVHELFVRTLSGQLGLPDVADIEERDAVIQRLSVDKFWTVLQPGEYWFARQALRGGRTEVRKLYHTISDEDWTRGVRIRYQDIVSMYPYVQTIQDYPRGFPSIEIYDTRYLPCAHHRTPPCDCDPFRMRDPKLRILPPFGGPLLQPDDLRAFVADPTFFGIVCATVTPPPDLYHPVLVHYDQDLRKSVASLRPILGGVFTSVEFAKAVEVGYEVHCIHRFDRYARRPSLWADLMRQLYLEKLANSRSAPVGEEDRRQLVLAYEQRFGMGALLEESFARWGKRAARKQTAKILLNSGWGKHAERPIMPESAIVDSTSTDDISALFANFSSGAYSFLGATALGAERTLYKYQVDGPDTRPNLHKTYLPAGLFVPAYGRLMLWEQLHRLGDRVLMHDTDSIVYVYDPDQYNIPEGGVWGDWEVEGIDADNGGIRTFVGLCPKSYGIRAENGKTVVKCKGVTLRYASEPLFHFDTMVGLVRDYLREGKLDKVGIPQLAFVYRMGKTMETRAFAKLLGFEPGELKGELDRRTGKLYPFGWGGER